MNLIINTDGAARGNPGQAAIGFVIKASGGAILHQEGKRIGHATNNEAEYSAVLKSMEYVRDHYSGKYPHQIEIVCDSQLIANQLSGNFKVKNVNLKELFNRIKVLEFELGRVSYRNVPREQNYIADRMANKALDDQVIE